MLEPVGFAGFGLYELFVLVVFKCYVANSPSSRITRYQDKENIDFSLTDLRSGAEYQILMGYSRPYLVVQIIICIVHVRSVSSRRSGVTFQK